MNYSFMIDQVKAIDNAINQYEQRKKDNINDKWQHHNEPDAIKEYGQYLRQIKALQKERRIIKANMILMGFE